MQITENTTLGEIIDKSGLQEWEYMISPLEFFDETAVPIPEVQKILRKRKRKVGWTGQCSLVLGKMHRRNRA